MANEINESHYHDRENVCGRECRNEECKCGKQTCFQVDDDNSGKDIDVKG
jgi:hypothetical protein